MNLTHTHTHSHKRCRRKTGKLLFEDIDYILLIWYEYILNFDDDQNEK